MRSDYEAWLRAQGYDEGTITAQLHRTGRVEKHHGDLDQHFAHDRLESVLALLRYSTEDQRNVRANPTKLPINGNLRNNLASYRNAVALYRRFLNGETIDKRVLPPLAGGAEGEAPRGGPPAASTPNLRAKPLHPDPVPPEHARTLAEFNLDGQAALAALIAASRYRTVAQAVASLTLFSHPRTVAQTGGKALMACIRGQPNTWACHDDGRELFVDDNKTPADFFRWCNGLPSRARDTQINHVWQASRDPDAYTALPNLCMTPAFLAKLTDTDEEVTALLKHRSFDLYGWTPAGFDEPPRPAGYAALEWAAPLPPVPDLAARLRHRFTRRPKDRAVVAASRIGWLFGEPADQA